MSLDLELLSHIVYGDKNRLLSFNLPKEIVGKNVNDTVDYMKSFYRENSKLPSSDTIYQELGIRVNEPSGDYEYVLKQIKEKHIHQTAKTAISKFAKLLSTKNYDEILSKLDEFPAEIRRAVIDSTEVEDLFSREKNKSVIDQYLNRKLGVYGVITPWPSINSMTWGWQPGDFALIGARSGVGKSFLMLHMALHAWREGKKVLLITPEMSRTSTVNRTASIELKISYENIRRGLLNSDQEKRYMSWVMDKENTSRDRFFIFSDEFEMYIEDLRDVVQNMKPDLVLVDGVYLLRTKAEKDRMRRAPIIADELKMMAKRSGVPVICSTQLNREAIKLKINEVTQGHFVLSDAFAWNVDYAFALGRDDKEKENKQMIIKPLKTREGDYNRNVILNWDFLNHNFSEYDPSQKKEEVEDDIPF